MGDVLLPQLSHSLKLEPGARASLGVCLLGDAPKGVAPPDFGGVWGSISWPTIFRAEMLEWSVGLM